jgi:hypothetical protein
MVGREEKTFKLANQPMVHLTYQTAFVDDGGKLVLRDDIYGFDARIRAILHSDERRIADVAPPQDPKRDLATARANQEILRRVERREAAGGPVRTGGIKFRPSGPQRPRARPFSRHGRWVVHMPIRGTAGKGALTVPDNTGVVVTYGHHLGT